MARRGEESGAGQRGDRQGINWVGGSEAIVAQGKGGADVLLVVGERGRGTCTFERAIFKQLLLKAGQIGDGLSERLIPVSFEVAAGQAERQREIA